MRSTPRHLRAAIVFGALALWACLASAADFIGLAGTRVHFATLDEAQEALGADDEWLALTTDFHRAATMQMQPPMSRERFRAFLAGTARAWSEPQQRRWSQALERLAPRFAALKVQLPPEVLLVATDGRDAAGAPYTRGRTVFLPLALADGNYADEELLAHELFHILSRHQPQLATRLYATLGFEPSAPLAWPASWAPLRIVNPDAPHDRHLMWIETAEGVRHAVMPVLMAGRATLRPGESFFAVMQTRLLEVSPGRDGQPTRPVLNDGAPVWRPAEQVAAYLRRLGGNTPYIIHPEETMADNFAFLVSGRPVPNPALLRRIESVLVAPLR